MFSLRDSILINATIHRCFTLSANVAIVEPELGMQPVAGRTSGFGTAGDIIRWDGVQ